MSYTGRQRPCNESQTTDLKLSDDFASAVAPSQVLVQAAFVDLTQEVRLLPFAKYILKYTSKKGFKKNGKKSSQTKQEGPPAVLQHW